MDIPYTVKPREDTGLYNAKVGIWLFLASEVMLFGALFSSYILLRVGSPTGTYPEVTNAWPHGLLNVPIGTFNTFVLIASSITVVMSWVSLKMNNLGKFKVYMGLTVLCALAFLGIKSFEYHEKFTHYQVWYTDGTTKTGHLEGSPLCWSLKTLKAKKLDHIMFTPDAPHGKGASHAAHPPAEKIEVGKIKRFSAYVPAHSPYFAIYFTLTALHGLHVLGGALVLTYFWIQSSKMFATDPERFTNRIEVGGLFWHFVDLVWIFLFPVLYLL
jgi:cytochrome c oxidase subunit 3